MKKTRYSFCVGTAGRYGMPVYRAVFLTEDERFVIKYQNKIIDVTMRQRDFVTL